MLGCETETKFCRVWGVSFMLSIVFKVVVLELGLFRNLYSLTLKDNTVS